MRYEIDTELFFRFGADSNGDGKVTCAERKASCSRWRPALPSNKTAQYVGEGSLLQKSESDDESGKSTDEESEKAAGRRWFSWGEDESWGNSVWRYLCCREACSNGDSGTEQVIESGDGTTLSDIGSVSEIQGGCEGCGACCGSFCDCD
ncbi:unnamed protein product [Amoebophrya sp. A120]|nr:unnamed protein product [Amoebophrya sp. A120]|eukprot:GSA120T00000159001.1